MTLTLAATFDADTDTVQIAATSSTDHAWGAYALTRSDANGTAAVRTQESLGFSSGELNLIDHEAALAGLVTYTISAGGETATAAVMPTSDRTWLRFPIMPHLSLILPKLSTNYDGSYEPNDNLFTPLDRDEPIIVFGSFGLREGTFEIMCATHEQALEIVNAYRQTRVAQLLVPDPTTVSMYHTVSRLSVRKYAPLTTTWLIEGRYSEVGRPSGPVLGTLGWSYADVATDHTDYDELISSYATYNDLVVGPTS